jgi:threonine dehydratase
MLRLRRCWFLGRRHAASSAKSGLSLLRLARGRGARTAHRYQESQNQDHNSLHGAAPAIIGGVSADSQLDGTDSQEFQDWKTLILDTRIRLQSFLQPTPSLVSKQIPGLFLKAESLQVTGSFKARTALAQLVPVAEEAARRGVVASSSGNFAQGVAWAARQLGISAKIVMMRSSNPLKVERTRRLGGEVIFCDDSFPARAATVEEIRRAEGRLVAYPYDHPLAIAGNASIALEILEQVPEVRRIVVPISGGGLISGILQAVRLRGVDVQVWGVQPEGSNATFLSFREGRPRSIDRARTVCDGLTVTFPGRLTFPILLQHAAGVLCIPEDEVRKATRGCWEEEKLVVEPSGAITLAPVLSGRLPAEGTVCVLSGGNLDPRLVPALFHGE